MDCMLDLARARIARASSDETKEGKLLQNAAAALEKADEAKGSFTVGDLGDLTWQAQLKVDVRFASLRLFRSDATQAAADECLNDLSWRVERLKALADGNVLDAEVHYQYAHLLTAEDQLTVIGSKDCGCRQIPCDAGGRAPKSGEMPLLLCAAGAGSEQLFDFGKAGRRQAS